MNSVPEFAELVADTRQSAAHLEMRDAYFTNPRFEAWQDGRRVDWDDRGSWWRPYHQNIADAVARGVHVRRVRIVSQPVTDYIAWEHYQTRANVEAGEEVRWLSRHRAWDLLVPGTDLWIFDGRLMRIHHFSGDGEWVGKELCDEGQHGLPARDRIRTDLGTGHPHDQYEVKVR